MIVQTIIAALTLGAISSFHCVGMCGPIVLALPVNHLPLFQRALSVLLYHAGRITTYMFLGLLFATLGRSVYMAGFQQYFSMLLGVVMLAMACYTLLSERTSPPFIVQRLYRPVQSGMGRALRSGNISGFLVLGLFNGLLPCGMVYMAIAAAMVSAQIGQGVLFMGFYGLGTFPAMLLLSLFSYRINLHLRNRIRKMMPLILAIIGIIFILRGMNLGIPFISPILPPSAKEAVLCH